MRIRPGQGQLSLRTSATPDFINHLPYFVNRKICQLYNTTVTVCNLILFRFLKITYPVYELGLTGLPGSHNIIVTLVLAPAESAFVVDMAVKLQDVAHLHQVAHQPVLIHRGATLRQQQLRVNKFS